ncbi:LexA family transcriptional regulator [Campylobacter sp. faydin G-140]|uniref:XRE family transcriptional regulator n=1 Tax=Campylobacter anatolicus TaxID=2829105 RepID=UPI001B9157A1|nr:XRE family transcriptional regulator [Campylobacter anatolicus]MBR8466362.1 LexA family transcriptional regulator [Campylobacter anatolicus]
MELSLRMKEYRDLYGWTQNDLSEKSGISISTIKKYEAGAVENFTYENLKKISSAFNVTPSDFLDEFLSVNLSDNHKKFVDQSVSQSQNLSVNLSDNPSNLKNSHKQTNIISIPYFEDTYASAGNGVINYDEAPVIMDFDEEFLRMFLRISGNISNMHIINSRGDSMEPTITSGELLFINPMQNESGLISGCIYIINYDGDIFVKRVEKNPVTKAITLFSDNEKYDPIIIEKHNLEHCYIIGRVVSHMKRA